MATRTNAFLRGFGGLFSWVDVLNRRLLAETPAEADAEALREVWEDVGGYLYDAMGALPPSVSNSPRQFAQERKAGESTELQFVELQQRAMYDSRPFPLPEILRAYEDLLPGSADRILSLAEQQQKQRAMHETRRAIVAFLAMLILIGFSAYLASVGLAWAGLVVVIVSVASSAGAFIYENRALERK